MPEPGTIAAGSRGLGVLLSVFTVGRDTKRNNKLALREYEDLARWVRDEDRSERESRSLHIEAMSKANLLYSSHSIKEDAKRMDGYAHRWRDRKSKSERLLEDLRDSENVVHKVWRWLRRRPWPTNPYGAEIAELAKPWNELLQGTGAR